MTYTFSLLILLLLHYYTTTPIERPLFQDNLCKSVPENNVKSSLDLMRQEMIGFWDAVASAEPYANNLHLAPDQ